ncbi:MAG TPA: 3-methyl-2-oxobutanoate dehydrogenase subunit VorB [Terriglobales bacterium]|nr:3-methyl-2-oxobutanoate dehydrogenase subunit VorB [Terriglobales bacterium]
MRQLCKGNVALVKGAILAGCRAFYGYPITPASEIAESAALYLPQVGGTFLQAESEVAAINMVYGAAAAGVRVMTASSGPGISLMQEGISYLAGAELPCVIVDVMRGGPGLGNIAPEQSDYFAMVKGGGHGNYRNLVLAPASVQEMADLTMTAFELADKYRNPVVVLADGFVGQMMEPLDIEDREIVPAEKPWAVKGTAETRANLISSIYLESEELEGHERRLEAKYIRAQQAETRFETYRTEDAEVLLVGFGIVSRVLLSTVDALRREGVKAGMFRPISLWPFPSEALTKAATNARNVLVVELSNGQMIEDVRLTLKNKVPVDFYGRVGGCVPSVAELCEKVADLNPTVENRTLFGKNGISRKGKRSEEKSVDPFSMVTV